MSEASRSTASGSRAEFHGGWFFSGWPWERITMWTALGLLLYVMRDFFLVIFMTFLLCYFVRRFVNAAMSWVPPRRRTRWLDRGIAISVFVALLALLTGLLGNLVPQIVEQSRAVFFKIEHAEWQVEFDRLLQRTVGEYLWRRSTGDAADPRNKDSLARYRSAARTGSGIFAALPAWESTLQARFAASTGNEASPAADRQARFRTFWDQQWTAHPQEIPFDYDAFAKLDQARARGEAEFGKVFASLLQGLPEDKKQALEQLDFKIAEQDRLATDWWDRDPAAISLRQYFNDEVPTWLSRSGASLQAMWRCGGWTSTASTFWR